MKKDITPAEENLKADFDQYEAPLDLVAFDQFKAALDHHDKPNNTRKITLIGLSAIIPVLLFLGITSGDFSTPSQEIGNNMQATIQETATLVNADNKNTINRGEDLVDINQTNNHLKRLQTIATEPSELQQSTAKSSGRNSSGLSDLVPNKPTVNTQSREIKKQQALAMSNFNTSALTQQVNGSTTSIANESISYGNRTISNSSIGLTKSSISNNQAKSNNAILRAKTTIAEKTEISSTINQTQIHTLDFIPNQSAGLLTNQSKVGSSIFTLSKLDLYRPHFYFGLEVGYTQARDYGSEDQFLKVHNRFGSQAKGIVGYQFSKRSAIEFGYQQRQVSSSWEYQTFFANSQSFVNTHLLSIALQNSLPLFKSRWAFTHKVGYIFGFGNLKSNDFNESGDFIDSFLLSTAFRYKEDFIGVESNVYHLLTGGVGFNYQLNYSFDIGINANYNIGLKPIRKSNVDYIYGEGLEGNYQGETRGKFVSLNLKVLYRMRS